MGIDTETRETEEESSATADGGLCRLDPPGQEPGEDEEPADNDRETA
jgi:hypothetical protein